MICNMKLPEFLTTLTHGEITLTDHRIGLYHVVQHYNDGDSAEMLAARYPTLPLSLVHKVLAFYLENQSEVDAYVASCSSQMNERQQAAPPLDLSALRSRLANQTPTTEAQVR
jgi:uncharacterized protein (DUF433 family)